MQNFLQLLFGAVRHTCILVVNQVFAVKDREEVESVAPTPDIIEEYYTPPDIEKVAHYKMQLEQLLRKVRCLAE